MPKIETKSLEERVREAIGSDVGLAFIEDVLKRDDIELLSWISNECDNNKQVIAEAYYYLEPGHSSELEFGMRILRSHLKIMLFFISEFCKRRGFEDAGALSE